MLTDESHRYWNVFIARYFKARDVYSSSRHKNDRSNKGSGKTLKSTLKKSWQKEQEVKRSKRNPTYYKKRRSSLRKMEEYTSLFRATYIPACDGEQYLYTNAVLN